MSIDFSVLQPLGWSPFHAQSLGLDCLSEYRPGRVVVVRPGRCRVDVGNGVVDAAISGRTRHLADASAELPTVGDWVLLGREQDVIVGVLPRRSLIRRGMAGGRSEGQPIAANVDTLLLVSSMDRDFKPRRLERYLAIAALASVTPVVVLTKADLCRDPARFVSEAWLPGVADVVVLDALHDPAAERLAGWVTPGATLAMVGSSGVGKSTLLNNLAGGAIASTAATRGDGKGRHTTTDRSLRRLPGGACLIDVPGMREVALPPDSHPDRAFADVEALARDCRFRDCRHGDEPGCAVRRAVESGDLDAGRLESFRRLDAEARRAAEQADVRLRRRKERAFSRMAREVKAVRRKHRGE